MLGYGSGGTVVLSGELDGRPVAVKRLLARFYDLARKEIDALIHVDDHPNVVCLPDPWSQARYIFNSLEFKGECCRCGAMTRPSCDALCR